MLQSVSNLLDAVLRGAEKSSQFIVWIGGGLLIFAALLTTAEVLLRKFLNFSFGGADEIAGYIFAISTAFAFAFATLHRAHVRIDALYIRLPRPAQLLLDVVGFLLLSGFLLVMTIQAYSVWWGSVENDSVSITPLVTPLAVPQGFWFAGMVFCMFVLAFMLLRIICAIISWDWSRISTLVSPRGIAEEVEAERENALAELKREQERLSGKKGD